jgi:hypothetical protein
MQGREYGMIETKRWMPNGGDACSCRAGAGHARTKPVRIRISDFVAGRESSWVTYCRLDSATSSIAFDAIILACLGVVTCSAG